VWWGTARTTGMTVATIAEELMKARTVPPSPMTSATSRASLLPPAFITASPRRCATPVAIRPSPTTDTAAIRTTTDWPKPASASWIVSTPVILRARTTRTATTSGRTRPDANSTTAPARTPNTISIWFVMASHYRKLRMQVIRTVAPRRERDKLGQGRVRTARADQRDYLAAVLKRLGYSRSARRAY